MEMSQALGQAIRAWKPERIIAADSGLRHLVALGLKPDILLGDMDSIDASLLQQAQAEGIQPAGVSLA